MSISSSHRCESRIREAAVVESPLQEGDPRIGTQTFTVTNLILSDPDPKLFEMPEGFTVVDRRQTALPQN
jgi:hypothetical protein